MSSCGGTLPESGAREDGLAWQSALGSLADATAALVVYSFRCLA